MFNYSFQKQSVQLNYLIGYEDFSQQEEDSKNLHKETLTR
jgi:hypothetical protein